MPTNTQLSLSTWATTSLSQGGKGSDPGASDYAMSTTMPSLVVSSTQSTHTTSSATAALDQTTATTTTSTLAPVTTDAGNHSLSPTAAHVLISAATIGQLMQNSMIYRILTHD